MKPELAIEPEVIVKKAKGHGHGHHGGAWKIAYADFVTAMMAFFMLLWILGATNEQQRKGIADYFTPTVVQMQNSGGSNGVMGGKALDAEPGAALRPQPTGRRPAALAGGTADQGNKPAAPAAAAALHKQDERNFQKVEQAILSRLGRDPALKALADKVKFVRTRDGLRIDLVERADFSMFAAGTSAPTAAAGSLISTVARAIADTPNPLTVRGHTDALPFAGAGGANNWTLSSARADATRRLLNNAGIDNGRFRRIEGVADTDPYLKAVPLDPRNRRISVTLLFQDQA